MKMQGLAYYPAVPASMDMYDWRVLHHVGVGLVLRMAGVHLQHRYMLRDEFIVVRIQVHYVHVLLALMYHVVEDGLHPVSEQLAATNGKFIEPQDVMSQPGRNCHEVVFPSQVAHELSFVPVGPLTFCFPDDATGTAYLVE
jgi:hypothetical protein